MIYRSCHLHGLYQGARCKGCDKQKARGYGWQHQKARQALRQQLPGWCAYGCGTWLEPDGVWVAAHVQDGNPAAGYIASCRGCNERAKRSMSQVAG